MEEKVKGGGEGNQECLKRKEGDRGDRDVREQTNDSDIKPMIIMLFL